MEQANNPLQQTGPALRLSEDVAFPAGPLLS